MGRLRDPVAKTQTRLLIDANVLIDYQKSDLSVLQAAGNIAALGVLTTILEEVAGFDQTDCERLGLIVIEPTIEQLVKAASKRGQLSFGDHLCLIVAQAQGFMCVTNDKQLRSACEREGVATWWGLQIMTELVRNKLLNSREAIRIAEKIHVSNPLHISKSLVDRFRRAVSK